MMTSGLVVLLEAGSLEAESTLTTIRAAPSLTVGEQYGNWLTIALETRDAVEIRRQKVAAQEPLARRFREPRFIRLRQARASKPRQCGQGPHCRNHEKRARSRGGPSHP